MTWREEQLPGNPPRKVYAITGAGRAALRDALMESPRSDVFKSEFLFLNLFADVVPHAHMQKTCADRIEALQNELERLSNARTSCDHPGSQFAIGYGIALTQAAIDYLKTTSVPSAQQDTVAAE